uniref:Uncharacterized protein n=1 Tax=Glossina palpalis gambiensis TaxID=67801 RepID=A0A1B0C013_9MUSC
MFRKTWRMNKKILRLENESLIIRLETDVDGILPLFLAFVFIINANFFCGWQGQAIRSSLEEKDKYFSDYPSLY